METYAEQTLANADLIHGGELPSVGRCAVEGDVNPFIAHRRDDDDLASIGEATIDELHGHITFPIADIDGNQFQYPTINEEDSMSFKGSILALDDEERLEAPHSVLGSGLECIKYLYSMALLIFSVIVVISAIVTKQTVATGESGLHPAIAFIIFWFLICWLAMMEGGQGALVGLQPVDSTLYAQSHPRTLKNTNVAHKGDNMERFIVGRQFLVVLVVFVINMVATSIDGASVLNLNTEMTEIFLNSSLAVILTTIMLGQLTGQVNASNCMLDFINNYFMLFTTYVSLAIEASGLLHCVYLVQMFFAKITGKPIESNEQSRSPIQRIFFWARVVISLTVLAISFAVTLSALFQGKTAMWDGVPKAASVVILFVLMALVGLMDGMQIALFAVVNIPEEELAHHTVAHKNCKLTFKDQNLQSFLIGRQICVTLCMFVVARITAIKVDLEEDDSENIFGVNDSIQNFFNTGLLGAVITTIVASLMWRVIASTFPVAFLSNPLISLIIRLCLLLEKCGICSASWVLARFHKLLVNYQPDEVHLEGAEPHTAEPVTRRDKDIDRLVTVLKFTYSLGLLAFAVILVIAAIFTKQTVATGEKGIHPVVAFFIVCFLISWLAMMEGGQGALVGLQPVDKSKYAETHPRTLKVTELAHKGDNMGRFIVGRQFLVVLVVFVTNLMASSIEDASVFGLPDLLNDIFLSTGLALILVTIMIGQLTAQVNAANCMLDFLNNYYMLFTTYVSLFIETSGLLHCVYLVQLLFSKLTKTPIESNEPERTFFSKIFFWARVVMSLTILAISFTVTLAALFQGKTTMWEGIPEVVSVIIFFILMCFVGIMEGMQIALFAVVNMPAETLSQKPVARANCELVFRDQNLQAFLIGRQICVTICMFVVARVTSIKVDIGSEDANNVFGVGDALQNFFNTGLLGAVITTVCASLAWRIVASSFPLAFLSNPLIYLIIRLCLFLEESGVCSASWVLGRFNKQLVGFQPDEVYLQGAEPHNKTPVTRRDMDIYITVTCLKYVFSLALLIFSIIIAMAVVFSEQTKVAFEVNPYLACGIFWFFVVWLAIMEGGQGCLVGLQPVDKELYERTHPVALKSTNLAHKGDNMKRFIVGRQFLVVLVVFVTNMCVAALADTRVLGLSDVMTEVFVTSGIAMILITTILGQITAQINAATCMLDFINNYFMLFTTYVSLAVEFSGLLHSAYLVQILFSKVTGRPIESQEPRKSAAQEMFFWARVLMSLAILCVSLAVTLTALLEGKTNMYEGVPEYVSVILFFVLMCFVGMMEGIQIALFTVVNISIDQLGGQSLAIKICDLVFSGNNLQAFLIGRQIFVTTCMFFIARITSVNVDTQSDDSENIFGLGDNLQKLFNTGLLGAVITTILASLAWRIIASKFPVTFLSNPLIHILVRLCLILEASGICSIAWLLAVVHKQIFAIHVDEVYIGTLEERVDTDPEDFSPPEGDTTLDNAEDSD